ncbi:MAG: urea ABC transporter permease subunit UrtC [Halothece sp.]
MTQVLPGVKESRFPYKFVIITGIIFVVFAIFPYILGPFQLSLVAKLLLYGVLAMSLDLVWGFTGILSFAQGVFFTLGGYMIAYHLKLTVSGDGEITLPDFMVWSGLEELPWFIAPLQYFPIALLAMLLVPIIFAYIIGWFVFNSRVSGVYITIISLAIASAMTTFLISQQAYTGGTNGITDLAPLSFFGSPLSAAQIYWLCLVFTTATFLFSWWLTGSNFGLILRSIKENENRVTFLGYNIANYKIFVWTLSAAMAGIAGGLFVGLNRFISPVYLAVTFGTQVVIWVAIGGRGTLIGPLVAAMILGQVQEYAEQITEDWQLVIGILLLVVVLFIPNGLMSLVPKTLNFAQRKPEASSSSAGYLQGQLLDWITPLQKLGQICLKMLNKMKRY